MPAQLDIRRTTEQRRQRSSSQSGEESDEHLSSKVKPRCGVSQWKMISGVKAAVRLSRDCQCVLELETAVINSVFH